MKTELGAVLLIALVAGSVGLGSYAGVHSLVGITTGTTLYVCTQDVPNPSYPVMVMEQGSSGVICIVYAGPQLAQPLQQPTSVNEVGPNGSFIGGTNGSVPGINATLLSVVARGLDNETVEYLITVAADAGDGAYQLGIGSRCAGFPLVVGNDTGVTSNLDHYYPATPWSCGPFSYVTEMVGVSAGITLLWLAP